MSALNPHTPRESHDERPSQEPSMEEILASIRRIISDDQSLAAAQDHDKTEHNPNALGDPPLSPAPPKWPHADVPRDDTRIKDNGPELRQSISQEPNPLERRRTEPYFKPAASDPKQFFSRQSDFKRPEPKTPEFNETGLRRRLDDDLDRPPEPPKFRRSIEPVAEIREEVPIVSPATDAAVASSFNTLVASQLMPTSEMLADLAREMLRPMLKAWLDDNLPVMVERLVRAEIERVARGGR